MRNTDAGMFLVVTDNHLSDVLDLLRLKHCRSSRYFCYVQGHILIKIIGQEKVDMRRCKRKNTYQCPDDQTECAK